MNKYHFSLHIFFKQDCDVNALEKIIGIKAYKKVLLKDSVGKNKSAKLWIRTKQEKSPDTVERLSKFISKMQPTFLLLQDYLNKFEEAKNNGDSIPDFSKQSQYMFIREKISRGYFREVGLSNGYIEKIELEKKLYELLLKLYLFYDVQTSLEFIYDINKELLNTYRILFL